MEGSVNNTLQHVEGLLRQKKYDEARPLLITYLKRNADSADAWWLLSQAIEDKEQQIDCLKRALTIDPNHAPARIYLSELEISPNTSPFTIAIEEESSTFTSEEEWADEKEDVAKTPPATRKKQPPVKKKGINKGLLALILILFALGILGIGYFAMIIIKGSDPNPVASSPSPTMVLETATPVPPQSLPPTWTPTFTPVPSPTPTFTTGSISNSSFLYLSVPGESP